MRFMSSTLIFKVGLFSKLLDEEEINNVKCERVRERERVGKK